MEGFRKNYNIVKQSPYFDVDFYLKTYPDVKNKNVDPIEHYLRIGYKEYRNPSDLFDTRQYVTEYNIITDINPLVHFIEYGISHLYKSFGKYVKYIENSYFFNPFYYINNSVEYLKVKNFFSPATHYLKYGYGNCNPSSNFDGMRYLEENKDVNCCPLLHYEKYGRKEKRSPYISKYFSFDIIPEHNNFKRYDVVIINTMQHDDGVYIWRVKFLFEELKNNQISVIIIDLDKRPLDFEYIISNSKVIIFVRKTFDWIFLKIYDLALRKGIHVLTDIDDYLLPTTIALEQGGIKSKVTCVNDYNDFSSISIKKVLDTIPIMLSDMTICSTQNIDFDYSKLVHSTCIRKNVISSNLIKKEKHFHNKNIFSIVISTGSDSHNYDLSTVIPNLINFISKHNDVQITFLGKFSHELNDIFPGCLFKSKLDFEAMLEFISKHDLVIVPLDLNHFNDCKSNIKFIEASVVHVPVMAPRAYEFELLDNSNERMIFLYDDDNFMEILENCKSDIAVNVEFADRAHDYACNNLTTHSDLNCKFISTIKEYIK